MGDFTRYLHKEYDGYDQNKVSQAAVDLQKAKEAESEIKATQASTFEYETETLSEELKTASKEEFVELCNLYNTKDLYKEYLVDGAVLRCTKATMKDFPLPNGDSVVLERTESENEDERVQMVLHVEENGINLNDKCYATVKDCIKGVNIFCPDCNCEVPIDRKSEEEKIMQDKDRNRFGVCRHLMDLNEEWDNMPLENGKSYLMITDVQKEYFSAGAGTVFESGSAHITREEVEGITMTSVLFCKHGGLITPVTSGQESANNLIASVSKDLISLLKKYETGKDKNGNPLQEGEPALYPYHSSSDASNVLTIGWGHAMRSFEDGWFEFSDKTRINLYNMCIYKESEVVQIDSITYGQAEEILQSDIASREKTLNDALKLKKIDAKIDQQFYDALFLLTYQVGTDALNNGSDLSKFLEVSNFDPANEQEIKEQFGEYTNHLEQGTMRRRADELDIIFYNTYERDYDETRYGDIWRKKTYPDKTTEGY